MFPEVALGIFRRPTSLQAFVAGMGAVLLWCSACSGSAASAVAVDAPTVEYAQSDAATPDGSSSNACSLVQVTPTSSVSCRADWQCPRLGVYSFTCGQPDGGSIMCYCRLNRDLQKSGVIDSCGIGPAAVIAAGEQFCGWGSLFQEADGGSQPSDGGLQPSDGRSQQSDGGGAQ